MSEIVDQLSELFAVTLFELATIVQAFEANARNAFLMPRRTVLFVFAAVPVAATELLLLYSHVFTLVGADTYATSAGVLAPPQGSRRPAEPI